MQDNNIIESSHPTPIIRKITESIVAAVSSLGIEYDPTIGVHCAGVAKVSFAMGVLETSGLDVGKAVLDLYEREHARSCIKIGPPWLSFDPVSSVYTVILPCSPCSQSTIPPEFEALQL